MSQYLPEVAWSTYARNVLLGNTPYRYKLTVNYLDPNESGANTMEMQVGDWFIDNAGYPFLIEEINGAQLTVYDVNERGDGVTSAYGPYPDKIGYVYRPKNGAFMLTQAQLRKLDPSASDIIIPIEKGIVWKYRGLNIIGDTFDLQNVTKLVLENIQIEELSEDGWQGGKKVKLRVDTGIQYTVINQVNHGFNTDVVYYDSIAETWTKAVASNEMTCGSHLSVKIDDDNFFIISNGDYVTSILDEDGNPLIPGEYYFLSKTNPGKITKIKPVTGITQYILYAVTPSLVTISVEEPYESVAGGGGAGASTFIELEDTPDSYENGKYLYATTDSIVYRTPLIEDILNLQIVLDGKASLPEDPINTVQFNSNGDLGSTPLYYNPNGETFAFGYDPGDYNTNYVVIDPGDRYGIFSIFSVELGGAPIFYVGSQGIGVNFIYPLDSGTDRINLDDIFFIGDGFVGSSGNLLLSGNAFSTGYLPTLFWSIPERSIAFDLGTHFTSKEIGRFYSYEFPENPSVGTKFYFVFDNKGSLNNNEIYIENTPYLKGVIMVIVKKSSDSWILYRGDFELLMFTDSTPYFACILIDSMGNNINSIGLSINVDSTTDINGNLLIRFYLEVISENLIKDIQTVINYDRYSFSNIDVRHLKRQWT